MRKLRKMSGSKMKPLRPEKGMTLIVKTITRLTVGLILLYGIYILSHGHVSPGGGFAGGVIVALSFIHIMLAYGKELAFSRLSKAAASFFESIGAIMFITIAILGFTGGYFFFNFMNKGEPFKLFSAGIIPLCNIAISLKVGAGLFTIFVILILLKFTVKDKGEK
jgi:multicomponent Na+:H+ antiporter subunit B